MQGDLGGQALLKPAEIMSMLSVAAEGMRELLLHRLRDLPHPSYPALEPLGPRRSALALRRAEDLGAIDPPPSPLMDLPLETFVDNVWPAGRGTHAR